jgi:uncharacterized membrane protein
LHKAKPLGWRGSLHIDCRTLYASCGARYAGADQTPAAILALTVALGLLAVLGGTLGGSLTFEKGLAVEVEQDER